MDGCLNIYNPKIEKIAIDGASGQKVLAEQMKDHGIKKLPILPKVGEIIAASSMFEQAVFFKRYSPYGTGKS